MPALVAKADLKGYQPKPRSRGEFRWETEPTRSLGPK